MKYYFTLVEPKHYDSIYEYRNDLLTANSKFDGCSDLNKYEDIDKWDFNNKLFEQEATLPPGYSIGFQYLYMDGDEVIGMLNFRPKAETHPYLAEYGGHIGYNIKPNRRGKGIGTQMLKDFLPIAKSYGLNKVMISCMSYNDASRKIITNNGGVFEAKVIYPPEEEMLERYWITL